MRKYYFLLFSCYFLFMTSCSRTNFTLLEEPLYNQSDIYIKHFAYSLSYNEETEQAKWVAYELVSSELIPNFERTNNFKDDPHVITRTATNNDYKGSGFDRGHLAPAADMVWNKQAMNESFLYSNISPQLPSFNRGIWKKLESKVRSWVSDNNSLFITCGPIFLNEKISIGDNGVVIPSHFYKSVLIYNDNCKKSIGFIFPHEKCVDDIFNYAVTIDSIETITNLDLYNRLPNNEEEKIESQLDIIKWNK